VACNLNSLIETKDFSRSRCTTGIVLELMRDTGVLTTDH